MKKAGFMQKILKYFFLCMIFGFFLSSCGLQEVYLVSAPSKNEGPRYDGDDYTKWYFDFNTSNDKGDNFLGTDVYYKIYNNKVTLESQRSVINKMSESTNSAESANIMINDYNYQPLKAKGKSGVVFYPSSTGERALIRLKTYKNGSSDVGITWYTFNAGVGTLSSNDYSPQRSNEKTFDFFDYNETKSTLNVEPSKDDSDYCMSDTFSESNCYYVQMYAVGVGINPETCTQFYSLALDLGSVPIRKGE